MRHSGASRAGSEARVTNADAYGAQSRRLMIRRADGRADGKRGAANAGCGCVSRGHRCHGTRPLARCISLLGESRMCAATRVI